MFSVQFSPVIDLPDGYEIYDFTCGYDPERMRSSEFGVGKYNEKRPTMYSHELFSDQRDIHMGVDIAAPVGTPIKSFYHGEVYLFGNNPQPGDYGYTLITKHHIEGRDLYALYGHLSSNSIKNISQGQKLNTGDVIAWVGDKYDNGGWNPHLHFQLSWLKPLKPDMPGVVSDSQRSQALEDYPDPRIVLGPIY